MGIPRRGRRRGLLLVLAASSSCATLRLSAFATGYSPSKSPAAAIFLPSSCRSRSFRGHSAYGAVCGCRSSRSGSSCRCSTRFAALTPVHPDGQLMDARHLGRHIGRSATRASATNEFLHLTTPTCATLAVIQATTAMPKTSPGTPLGSLYRRSAPVRTRQHRGSANSLWKPWTSDCLTLTKLYGWR